MTPEELVRDALAGTDHRIAVTGATGWFGATAMDLAYAAFGGDAPDRVVGYASVERELVVADGRVARIRAVSSLSDQLPAPTILLHFAFLTREKVATLGVDAYVRRNVALSATVLDAVAVHRPRALVYASSGAVYGSDGRLVHDLEGDPYGTLKHLDELAMQAAAARVGGVAVVPRIFSVAGDRITKPEAYALGSFLTMGARDGVIDVQARGPVVRSYCGVDEVVALSLWSAVHGRAEVFDSGGPVVEMSELAAAVATVLGLAPEAVRRATASEAPPNRYAGSGARMAELAAEAGLDLRELDALVRTTAAGMGVLEAAAPGSTRGAL